MRRQESDNCEFGGATPQRRGPAGRSAWALAGALAIALVVAGCGGGQGGSSSISRAEFVDRAEAICKKAGKQIEVDFAAYTSGGESREAKEAEEAGELTASEATARLGEEIVIPAMRRQLDELRALGMPENDDGSAAAFIDSLDEGLEKAEAHPERAARDGTEAFGKSERLAEEYGLSSC